MYKVSTIQLIFCCYSIRNSIVLFFFLSIVLTFCPKTLGANETVDQQESLGLGTKTFDQDEVSLSKVDSLKRLPIDTLNQWVRKNAATYIKEYPTVAHFALSEALKSKNYNLVASIHGKISFWNYYNYEVNGFDTIVYHRIKQIEYDEMVGNWKNVGYGYLDLSVDYYNNNQLQKGQEILFESLRVFETINDAVGLVEVQRYLSQTYNDINEPLSAIKYSDLCLPFFIAEKDYAALSDVYMAGHAKAYVLLKDFTKALIYVDKSIDIALNNDFGQSKVNLVKAYEMKGLIYSKMKNFELAEINYNKAWQISLEYNSIEVSDKIRLSIGGVLYKQGLYEKALPHMEAGVEAAEVLSGFDSEYYLTLSKCYEKNGQNKQALLYSKKAFDFEKKTTEEKIKSLQSESLIKYESGRKDQQLLEQKQIIQQKNWIQWITIGAASLLALLLFMLYYFFRKNKKNGELLFAKNKLIEERNQQNELLLKEIHHRVKNNLEIVSSLLALQARQLDDQSAKSAMTESQNRVQSMGIIHQKLYQGENLAAIEMKDYFVNLGDGILDSFGKRDQVEIAYDLEEIELDVDTAVPIGLIVNELFTNALKYAFVNNDHPQIQLELERQVDNSLRLTVSDNGIGISNNLLAQGTGFGSQLIELLTQQLDGEMTYLADIGSQFSFTFRSGLI